jgi:hypothetical protein
MVYIAFEAIDHFKLLPKVVIMLPTTEPKCIAGVCAIAIELAS